MTISNGWSSAGWGRRDSPTAVLCVSRAGRALSFIGSDKRVLRRVIREAGVILTPAARANLDALPEQFLDFIAAPDSFRIRIAA